MQIKEITLKHDLEQAAHSPWQRIDMVNQAVEKHGWHILGTGAEAVVAEHPQKAYVLKIFDTDSRYEAFVEFVKYHATNPHLPKFSRYVKKVPGTEFSYVRMEKLQPITPERLAHEHGAYIAYMIILSDVVHMNLVGDDVAEALKNRLAQLGHTVADLKRKNTQKLVFEKLGGWPPESWQDVVSELTEYSEEVDTGRWDLHADNFLVRGNTLVIADPFY